MFLDACRPHNWLLIYMRLVLLLYTINNWVGVSMIIMTELEAAGSNGTNGTSTTESPSPYYA